jgi:hypothetical protein
MSDSRLTPGGIANRYGTPTGKFVGLQRKGETRLAESVFLAHLIRDAARVITQACCRHVAAEKLEFRGTAPKGAIDCWALTLRLKA